MSRYGQNTSPMRAHCLSPGRPSSPGAAAASIAITDGLSDSRFRQNLREMRLTEEMCDVRIRVENSCFAAHKLILASCSPYFRAMFRANNFDESQKGSIHIDPKCELGIKAEAVERLLDFIYTGKISVHQGNAVDLVRAADLLELSAVKNHILIVIEKLITFETYSDVRDVGNVFHCPRLLVAVDKFIHRNFSCFVRTPAFYELDEQELVRHLSHDHLRTDTEEAIFDAALSWCKAKNALDLFPSVGRHVRFNLISIKHVLKTLRDDADVRSMPEVSDFLLEKLHAMAGSLHVGPSRPRFSTRVLIAMPYASRNFYVIMFHGGDSIDFSVNHFPSRISDHVESLANFAVCRVGHSSLMYLAGGDTYNETTDNLVPVSRGLVYDVLKDAWCAAPPLPIDCSNFGMAAVGDKVYVSCTDGSVFVSDTPIRCVGAGCENHRVSNDEHGEAGAAAAAAAASASASRSSSLPREGVSSWILVARMNYARSSVLLVGVGGKLYAIGGMLEGGFTSLVEMYDSEADIWMDVDSMSEARCNPGVAVAGGKIYVAGGVGESVIGPPGALKTVEYYDPESDTWTHLPDMYFPRYSPAVAHVNNKLFVFGGGSPSQMARPGPETTIECFDFERHEWFVLQTKIPGTSDAYFVGSFFDYLET